MTTFSPDTNYRRDIAGLRAIAVLSVVIFHFDKSALPGGFLGVDIFFVISGYLITNIILKQIHSNSFSLSLFYRKRLLRLAPALVFMLVPTTVVALVLLLPTDLVGYGKSLLATAFFVSNIYFWRDTNYFSAAAENKPLLHMWSLSVEEQFYLIFPLCFMLLIRLWSNRTILLFISICIISYLLNYYLNSAGGRSLAFYLLPTRIWQLGSGVLLALILLRPTHNKTLEFLSYPGLMLIGISIFFPALLPHPIPQGTLVVLGTILVIAAGTVRYNLPSHLLARQPSVFFGEISYSLYLWHWPVVVFANYYYIDELPIQIIFMAACFMIIMATISTYLIEAPIRRSRASWRTIAPLTAIPISAILLVSYIAINTNGLPNRLNEQAASVNASVGKNYRCPIQKYLTVNGVRGCELNLDDREIASAQVALFGNSHIQMYAPLWEQILKEHDINGVLLPQNGCLPISGINIRKACLQRTENLIQNITNMTSIKLVVIGFNWNLEKKNLVDGQGAPVEGDFRPLFIDSLNNTINTFKQSGKQVILIGPIAVPESNIASEVSRKLAFKGMPSRDISIPYSEFIAEKSSLIAAFDSRTDIGFIRVDQAQCDRNSCFFIKDNKSLFADSNHLSITQLSLFRPIVYAEFMKFSEPLTRAEVLFKKN